ncbi:MAG: sugar phosphate isomerase/epimerase [Eubacteriales bacterium]|nr:sugar phosphate isomerase/epimerase [Eubacteriales bacterium]
MSRISLQMYTLRDYTKTLDDLAKTLEKLKEIGFDMLQYSIPDSFCPKEVKARFDALGIRNDSVFCDALKLEERATALLEQCELFGTRYVRINSIPRDLSSTATGYKMFAHYLNEVTRDLKAHGVKLLYHFHSFEFIRCGEECGIDILLKETDPEVVQIIPDTHWIHCGGKAIPDFLNRYSNRYDYVHCKDIGIGKMGSTWEARPIEFAAVGEGNLDWSTILPVCKQNGVLSYAIEQDDCYGRDPFDCVRSSYQFLVKNGVND